MFNEYLVSTTWCFFRVSDRGDDLQMWKAAGNILTKTSRTADKGCPGWRMGEEIKTPHRKKACYKMLPRALNVINCTEVLFFVI
jgi:hypothetical protein